MNKRKKIIIILVSVLLIAALAIFGGIQFKQYQKNKQKADNKESYQKLQEAVVTDIPEDTAAAEDESTDDISIDFTALQQTNPDIYAWIYIPGTEVSYPMVQSDGEDQSYYLNYTAEKQYGLPGSIYTENVNKKDFTDFNTIIYGHEMLDGSMFGNLKAYRDTTYWEQHPEIYIYTPEKKYTFRIFAGLVFDDRYIPDAYDVSTQEGKAQYLNDIQSSQDINSHVFEDAYLTADCNLITLSTCISDQPDNRYLVVANLTEVRKINE